MGKKKQGIFTPFEFYKIKELSSLDLDVLSFYRYYTLEGHKHCCEISNEKICEKFEGRFGVRNLQKIKKKLKDLGLIKTDGGVRVWYIGLPEMNNEGDEQQCVPGANNLIQKDEQQFAHKKEKEIEKKEIIKEIKEIKETAMKNDLILDEMLDRKNKPAFKEWFYKKEELKNVIDAIKEDKEGCYDKDAIKEKVDFWYKIWYSETKEWVNDRKEEKVKKSKEEEKKDYFSENGIEWF